MTVTVRKAKFAWKHRRALWKYRQLIQRRKQIAAGVALAAAAILASVLLKRGARA
jgi:hypothetical protein